MAKKPGAQKSVANKVAAKKAAPKPVAKKAASTKPVAKKAVAKKAVAKKAVAVRTTAHRVPAARTSTRSARPGSARPAAARPGGPTRRPPAPPLPPHPGDPDRRIRWVALVSFLVLLVFTGRLVQVQVVQAGPTAAAATDALQTEHVLAAHRGDIVDRNDAVLATSVERRDITVDQKVVVAYREAALRKDPSLDPATVGVRGAATAIARVLGSDPATVRRALTGTKRFAYVAKDVEPALWRRVDDLDVPGIYSEKRFVRTYPGQQVAASVVGFVGKDGAPLAGVERALDSQLQGTDGVLTYESGAGGQQIPTGAIGGSEPVPGRMVQLTIDRDLQWKTQEVLCAAVKQTEAQSGQAVVLDPRSGQVLALAGCPTFDANKPGTADPGSIQNRALVDVFEPGSTAKVITAAAALQEGKVTAKSRLTVDYTIDRADRTFHDSHRHPPEKLTFAGVLAQSSNTGTIQVGERVDPGTMGRYLRAFGLGAPSGIGLPESRGLLADPKDWNASQRYTVLFGQGLSVTAIQAAQVFATIANDGVRVRPSVVKAVEGPGGELVDRPAEKGVRVIDTATARQLRLILESVVGDDGTAIKASVPGYRVAGKTGTAEAYDDACGCYNGYTASFVGMAPAEKPALVVAVFLQKPQNDYYGGTVAAPVFQKVMTYALARQNLAEQAVEPSRAKAPRVPLTWD